MNNKFLNLGTDSIKIRLNQEESKFHIGDLKGIILFLDHYKGFSANHIDLKRNGNSILFLEFKNGPSRIIKFNIPGKEHLKELDEKTKKYSRQIEYYKNYSTNMIGTVLTKDMTKPKEFIKTDTNNS